MKEKIEHTIFTAVSNVVGTDLPVPPDFDEAAYLRQNPDVAAAKATGELQSGYMHYLVHGRLEGRKRPTILA